jgi:hypothetical protein
VVFDDALPREDSGKIFKRRIRDRYWRGAKVHRYLVANVPRIHLATRTLAAQQKAASAPGYIRSEIAGPPTLPLPGGCTTLDRAKSSLSDRTKTAGLGPLTQS